MTLCRYVCIQLYNVVSEWIEKYDLLGRIVFLLVAFLSRQTYVPQFVSE